MQDMEIFFSRPFYNCYGLFTDHNHVNVLIYLNIYENVCKVNTIMDVYDGFINSICHNNIWKLLPYVKILMKLLC